MGLIIGEIRAALGAIGALFGIRRRRLLLLEGRQQLDKVFREAVANLAGIRQSWSAEHDRMNWLARLHGDLLHTGAWRGHRVALTTRLDGGPVIEAELAGDLDQLYDELDESAAGFRFDWEPRLVDVALRLRDVLEGYPPR